MKTYGSGGINWNWYLEVNINGDEVEILRYYRRHLSRDEHPKTCGEFSLVEQKRDYSLPNPGPRLVVGVELNDGKEWKRYTVSNPMNPFAYGE